MSLDAERLDRFARHIVLPEIGGAGQITLAGKHLVLVGLGGIGSPRCNISPPRGSDA